VADARFADGDDISADYQELLGRGYVLRRYANALGWISAINAEGRADCLHLDSTISPIDPRVAWAILRRAGANDPMYETARIMLLREIALQGALGEGELDQMLDH
jgi:hypothetical protein